MVCIEQIDGFYKQNVNFYCPLLYFVVTMCVLYVCTCLFVHSCMQTVYGVAFLRITMAAWEEDTVSYGSAVVGKSFCYL